MKHYTLEQWVRYARQEPPLTTEEQSVYEEHLLGCEDCLGLYMQSLDFAAADYPVWPEQQAAMEKVMQSLPSIGLLKATAHSSELLGKGEEPGRSRGWLRHPIFHYALAASITLILMSSGAFQTLMDRLEQGDAQREAISTTLPGQRESGHTPVSQTIMNKTIVMLDSIQAKHDRGGAR